MCGPIKSPLTGFGQCSDIAPIRLDASAAVTVHRRKIRIGHDRLVSERLEVLRDPLTLGRGFQENSHPGPAPEHGRKAFAGRCNSSIDDLTTLHDDADLTFLFVQVDGTILHGWSSPLRLKSAFQQCGAQATTSLRRPAASSYLRPTLWHLRSNATRQRPCSGASQRGELSTATMSHPR